MIKMNKTGLRVLYFTAISTLSVVSANAGGILGLKPIENSSKAVVSISNIQAKYMSVSVEDASSRVVYYEERVSNASDFAKVFDFSLLTDGDYKIVLKAGDEELSQSFVIANSTLTVKEALKLKEPIFNVEGNSLLVYFNSKNTEGISVTFSDGKQNFFTDELSKHAAVRKYSLADIPSGKYTVSVSADSGFFSYEFSK